MGSRLSAKTRVFLDGETVSVNNSHETVSHALLAIHNHFSGAFRKHQLDTGSAHPDTWALHYLSKNICEWHGVA